MTTGKVKWFNTTKGFGLIQPDDGGGDVFVHIKKGSGSIKLQEGEKVAFELQPTESGKMTAEGVTRVPA